MFLLQEDKDEKEKSGDAVVGSDRSNTSFFKLLARLPGIMALKKLLIFPVIFLFCCSPPSRSTERNPFYSQNFSSPDAWLTLEWNEKEIRTMASGSLMHREKGILMTARHFIDDFESSGSDTCKVLMNGVAYKAFLLRLPPLKDAGLIKLIDFDPQYLPDPYPISDNPAQAGDRVFVRGFHVHPNWLIERNREEAYPDHVVPIIREYYKNFGRVLRLQNREVVYHDIPGTVRALNQNIELGDNENYLDRQRNEANLYTEIGTDREHYAIAPRVAFGGLSGGVALNADNEVVGIVTAERIDQERIPMGGPFVLAREKHDTIFITPIENVQALLDYAKQVR